MRNLIYIVVLIIPALFITCCAPKSAVEPEPLNQKEMQDLLITQNKEKLKAERVLIQAYVDSSDYEFEKTGSGLLYSPIFISEYKEVIKEGDLLRLEYTLKTIKGTPLETSKKDGIKEVRFLRDNEILGLHEGLAFMHLEDEYVFVIPAHLGFGLGGDLNIPSSATLIYKVKLISINK